MTQTSQRVRFFVNRVKETSDRETEIELFSHEFTRLQRPSLLNSPIRNINQLHLWRNTISTWDTASQISSYILTLPLCRCTVVDIHGVSVRAALHLHCPKAVFLIILMRERCSNLCCRADACAQGAALFTLYLY